MTKPILFSFFAGAGLMDLGFERAGFTISFINEIHAPFLDAYKYSRQNLKIEEPEFGYHQGSIVEFSEGKEKSRLIETMKMIRQNGRLVGMIGGPPCPDFSIGGKNRGRKGDQGKLSYVYFGIINLLRPDFFLFENVKGMISTKRHLAFYQELKKFIKDSGYAVTDKLINSIEYKTPQDRDRIILIGFDKDLLTDIGILISEENEILPENVFPWHEEAKYPGRSAFSYPWPEKTKYEEDSELPSPESVPIELTVEYWFRKNDVYNHPNSNHHFKPKAGLSRFKTIDEGDDSKKSFKRLHRWRYSPTAAYGNNEVHLHPYKPRRISASEALAVQSMPKGFILPPDMSLSNMFKAIGNGVPFLAAKALAKSILKFLNY